MPDRPILSPEEERFLSAGEYALGVLEGAELDSARRKTLSDPVFADAVDWWALRLAAMAEEAGQQNPRDAIWDAIARRIDTSANTVTTVDTMAVTGEAARNGPAPWSIAMALGGAGLAAAALALFIATPQPVQIGPDTAEQRPAIAEASPSQLIAQLTDDDGGLKLAGIVQPASQSLTLDISGFEPAADQAPQLWVVPQGGAPVWLGPIPASGKFERKLTARERALLIDGATLAVTIEPDSETPLEAPTTPILLAGPLDEI